MLLLNYFVDYRKTERMISLQDQKLTANGKPCIKRLTDGCEICVLWKDEITTWENMSDLKECYLFEVSEYAVLQKIDNYLDFNW